MVMASFRMHLLRALVYNLSSLPPHSGDKSLSTQTCAHVNYPVSICRHRVGLTADGMDRTRKHCTQVTNKDDDDDDDDDDGDDDDGGDDDDDNDDDGVDGDDDDDDDGDDDDADDDDDDDDEEKKEEEEDDDENDDGDDDDVYDLIQR